MTAAAFPAETLGLETEECTAAKFDKSSFGEVAP